MADPVDEGHEDPVDGDDDLLKPVLRAIILQ